MYLCPYCGNFIDKESKFCGKCGNKFHPKICPKCNYQSYFNNYCINCGEKLEFLELYLDNLHSTAFQLECDDKYEDALNIYEKLLEFKPNNKFYLNDKARCLHSLGKYEAAIEYYDKIINIDSDYDLAWYGKGICLFELNRLDESLECINKAIDLDPNDRFSLFRKADILFKLNRSGEVKEVLSKIKPDTLSGWYTLHEYYIKIKEYGNALNCVDEMLSLEYDYFPLFLKGKIYFKLKNYDEAMKCCEEALNFNSEHEELNELIEKINIAQKNSKSGD